MVKALEGVGLEVVEIVIGDTMNRVEEASIQVVDAARSRMLVNVRQMRIVQERRRREGGENQEVAQSRS